MSVARAPDRPSRKSFLVACRASKVESGFIREKTSVPIIRGYGLYLYGLGLKSLLNHIVVAEMSHFSPRLRASRGPGTRHGKGASCQQLLSSMTTAIS